MPAWLISLLLSLALKLGLPWLLQKFPWIPAEIAQIIQDLIDKINGLKAEKKELVLNAHKEIKRACEGPLCPTDTKYS